MPPERQDALWCASRQTPSASARDLSQSDFAQLRARQSPQLPRQLSRVIACDQYNPQIRRAVNVGLRFSALPTGVNPGSSFRGYPVPCHEPAGECYAPFGRARSARTPPEGGSNASVTLRVTPETPGGTVENSGPLPCALRWVVEASRGVDWKVLGGQLERIRSELFP